MPTWRSAAPVHSPILSQILQHAAQRFQNASDKVAKAIRGNIERVGETAGRSAKALRAVYRAKQEDEEYSARIEETLVLIDELAARERHEMDELLSRLRMTRIAA